MTVVSTEAGSPDPQLFAEIVGILREVTGESAEWAADITPNARLEVDLGMESIELIALGKLLEQRYGPAVDLPGFVAGLDIDQIIGLSVGELTGYVAARRATGAGPAPAGQQPAAMPGGRAVMPGRTGGGGA